MYPRHSELPKLTEQFQLQKPSRRFSARLGFHRPFQVVRVVWMRSRDHPRLLLRSLLSCFGRVGRRRPANAPSLIRRSTEWSRRFLRLRPVSTNRMVGGSLPLILPAHLDLGMPRLQPHGPKWGRVGLMMRGRPTDFDPSLFPFLPPCLP